MFLLHLTGKKSHITNSAAKMTRFHDVVLGAMNENSGNSDRAPLKN